MLKMYFNSIMYRSCQRSLTMTIRGFRNTALLDAGGGGRPGGRPSIFMLSQNDK